MARQKQFLNHTVLAQYAEHINDAALQLAKADEVVSRLHEVMHDTDDMKVYAIRGIRAGAETHHATIAKRRGIIVARFREKLEKMDAKKLAEFITSPAIFALFPSNDNDATAEDFIEEIEVEDEVETEVETEAVEQQ